MPEENYSTRKLKRIDYIMGIAVPAIILASILLYNQVDKAHKAYHAKNPGLEQRTILNVK